MGTQEQSEKRRALIQEQEHFFSHHAPVPLPGHPACRFLIF